MISFSGKIKIKTDFDILKNFIILFPFFEPRIFSSCFGTIDKVFVIFQAASFIIIASEYILRSRYSYFVLFIGLYRAAVLVSTLYNGNLDLGWFSKTIMMLSVTAYLEIAIEKDALKALKSMYLLLIIPLLINLFMCLFGIHVVYNGTIYYFIGIRTRFTDSMIPAVLVAFILSWYKKGKIFTSSSIFVIIVCLIQLIKLWIATGLLIVSLLIFLSYLGFNKTEFFDKIFNVWIWFMAGIALNIGIVFFQIQNIFSFIIEGILHKSLTFTGRTSIWKIVIDKLSEHILIGHGESGTGGIVKVSWANRLAPAHNTMLQILYESGLIGFLLFLCLFILIVYTLYKNRNYIKGLNYVFAVSVIILPLNMLTEILHYQVYLHVVLIIVMNYKRIAGYKFSSVYSFGTGRAFLCSIKQI